MNRGILLLLAGALLAAMAWMTPVTYAQGEAGTAAGDAATQGDAGTLADLDEKSDKSRIAELIEAAQTNWETGGPTMYFLAVAALVGFVFMIDRIISLRRGVIVPHGLADRANQLWQQGDFVGVAKLGKSSSSALGDVIAFLAEHRGNTYEHLTSAAEDIAGREYEKQSRRNYPLIAVGTIAPLLGLTGTVLGLMGAFASIGVYGSMDDPSVLAKDIGEAMVTTATGLFIAVPALALYHYFRNRTSQLTSILGEEVSNLMHAWFLKQGEK